MSDNWAASIEIGGSIPKVWVKNLVQHLVEDNAQLEWGPCAGDEDLLAAIQEASKNGTTLTVYCDQARNGQFEETEKFLRHNNMSFRRHSDAYIEYDAEIVLYWHDKFGTQDIVVPSNQEGHVFFSLPYLKCALAEKKKLKDVIDYLEAAESSTALPVLKIEP